MASTVEGLRPALDVIDDVLNKGLSYGSAFFGAVVTIGTIAWDGVRPRVFSTTEFVSAVVIGATLILAGLICRLVSQNTQQRFTAEAIRIAVTSNTELAKETVAANSALPASLIPVDGPL